MRTPDGLTEAFLTLIGVLQGDTLAPLLFIIVLDYFLRQSMKDLNILQIVIEGLQHQEGPGLGCVYKAPKNLELQNIEGYETEILQSLCGTSSSIWLRNLDCQ